MHMIQPTNNEQKTPNFYKHSGFANHTGCVVPTDSTSNTQTAMAVLKRIYFWHVRTTIHLPNDVPMTSLKWTTINTQCQFQPVPFISLDDFRFDKGWWQSLKPCIFNEVTFFETAPDFSNASRHGWILRPFFWFQTAGLLSLCQVPRLLYDAAGPWWSWHHGTYYAHENFS